MDDVEQAENLSDLAADGGQGWARCVWMPPTFDLEKGQRDSREDDMVRPARIAEALEVVQAEVVLQSRYCSSIGHRQRASATRSKSGVVAGRCRR